jgi:Ca-activated chloride channel family protein
MTVRITSMTDAEPQRAVDDTGLGALRTERGGLPLERIDIRVDITGLTSQVEVTQDFVNTFDVPLEASYVFPLPDRAAVTGMRMTANGRVVAAALAEREAARAAYDRAVTSGRRASIAEEERPDVFTMRVGNISPGEKVSVAITLVNPLAYADGEATFRLPLVVAPRHIPGEPLDDFPVGDGYADDTDAVPDASRITPPVLLPGFPHPIALTVDIGIDPAGLTLSDVRSSLPTEPSGGGRIRVLPGQRADRDLVLRLRYAVDDFTDTLLLVPDTDGDEGTYQLTVLPPESTSIFQPPRPRDLVLLLDHSASMSGWKMTAARRAAARIIDTLTGVDRFAVLSFNDRIQRPSGLPDGLAEATDRNRFRAVEHLAGVESDGGGELFAPLREGLALLRDSDGRDAVVVLVTDGQVGNEDQLLRGLAADLRGVRVLAIGMDQAVNAGFLTRLAAAGGGRCELVESEDRLDEVMEAIHRRVAPPRAYSLALRAEGLATIDDTMTPARLPDAVPGVPLVVSGRYRGTAEGSIVLRGSDGGGGHWSVVVAGRRREAPAVTAAWVRAHLRDLEDRYAAAAGTSSAPQLAKRIVDTSLRFGVLCRFTAYASLDGPVVAIGGLPHRVMQPVEAPAGWDPASVVRPAVPSELKTAQTRMVKLRNVIVVAVVSVLVLGGGWVWSLGRGGPSVATRDGVVGGKMTESPEQSRSRPSGQIPTTMGGGIADQTTLSPAPLAPPADNNFKRDIVTNGSLHLVVGDPGAVADRLITSVNDAGGRVDSRSERSGQSSPVVDLVVRVPADKLDGVLADTKKLGTVESMSISHTDVTTQRVDLDARIDALQTSVKRLMELMSKAGDVADLLAAESSLTQRQAELDSLKAQRSTLHDEIDYATITVNISSQSTVTQPGFFGELARGWRSVLAAAHGGVLTVGFLLPWLVLLALPVLGLVLVMRRLSPRQAAPPATEG